MAAKDEAELREAAIRYLRWRVEDLGEEVADEIIHELKSSEAADINNGGYEAQAEYLVDSLGVDGAVGLVARELRARGA